MIANAKYVFKVKKIKVKINFQGALGHLPGYVTKSNSPSCRSLPRLCLRKTVYE